MDIHFMTGANPNDKICLNPDCLDYQKKNTRHVIKNGFNSKSNQMFKCKTCGVRSPETKGTESRDWSGKILFFETKDTLLRFGAEKESYDQVIKKLIGDAGWKELDARWNHILAENESIPLDEL